MNISAAPLPARSTERRWSATAPESSAAIDVVGVLKILRRRWKMLTLFVLAAAIAGLAYALTATPRYTAFSSLMVGADEPRITDIQSLVEQAGRAPTVQNEAAILVSREFAWRVIEKLNLDEKSEFNPALRSGLLGGEPVTAGGEIGDNLKGVIIDSLLNTVTIQNPPDTMVLTITVTTKSAEQSAAIANAMADLYAVDRLEAKFQATQRASSWLTERLADLRQKLEASESAVQRFRAEAGLTEGDASSTLIQQELSGLNAQVIEARGRRTGVEERLRRMEALGRSGGYGTASEVISSSLIQDLIRQEAEAGRQVADLSSRVGADHPDMRSARAAQDGLRAKIGAEIGRLVEGLRNEARVASSQEEALSARLQELEQKMAGLSDKLGELRILEREAEADRSLYETFLSKFKTSENQGELTVPEARVISRAHVPNAPSFPNVPMILAVSILSGLVAGFIAIGLTEQSDKALRSAEEVMQHLELPCVALVPAVSGLQRAGRTLEEYCAANPGSAYAESIRHLRAETENIGAAGRCPVISLTSSVPNEGKTATTLALAHMHGLSGKKVVVLDFDIRKPSVAERLGGTLTPGLVEYLKGQASIEQVLQRNERAKIDFIGAGAIDASARELLQSDLLKTFVTALTRSYDLVIIDTAPVLAVADARVVARISDKMVFVTRFGQTGRETCRIALHQLAEAGADFLGVVLTQVDVRIASSYSAIYGEAYGAASKKYYTS